MMWSYRTALSLTINQINNLFAARQTYGEECYRSTVNLELAIVEFEETIAGMSRTQRINTYGFKRLNSISKKASYNKSLAEVATVTTIRRYNEIHALRLGCKVALEMVVSEVLVSNAKLAVYNKVLYKTKTFTVTDRNNLLRPWQIGVNAIADDICRDLF